MRPTTAQLEALIAVAEAGSISAAAQRLSLTQPTVSATLARLEAVAGTALLERAPGGTRLTPAGQEVVTRARPALDALDEVGRVVDTLRGAPSPVRVAASYTIAEQLLPVWLAGCPVPTQVEVCNSERVQRRVRSGEVEIGFIEGASVADSLEEQAVAHDELVLVVAPEHPWARRSEAVTHTELIGPTRVGSLVLREEGSGAREVLARALAERGTTLPGDARVLGSNAAVLTAVRHSGSHAVLARAAAQSTLDTGEVVQVPVALDLRRRLRLVTRRSGRLRPEAQAVIAVVAPGVAG